MTDQSLNRLLICLAIALLAVTFRIDETEARACKESKKCDCQRLENFKRIVGGTEADVHEYPYMVHVSAIFDTEKGRVSMNCGGTLISDEWVLTAGHCILSTEFPGMRPLVEIRVGEHIKSTTTDTGRTEIFYTRNYVVHKGYSLKPIKNDIALVKLDRPLSFSDAVSPACLPNNHLKKKNFKGQMATATGWGRILTNKQGGSDILKELELKVYSGKNCRRPHFKYSSKTVSSKMLCGYTPGANVCNGDSGGPLMYEENGHKYVIGVASFVAGPKCAYNKKPGVFVNVASYLKWIEKNTGEKFCTVK